MYVCVCPCYREKDLELKVAATGANDPEKQVSWKLTTNPQEQCSLSFCVSSEFDLCLTNQPDRIRQFGLSRRKDHRVLEPSTGESETSSRSLPNNEKAGVRGRETPPPVQPHVAFQSPVLEYSSALEQGGLSPNSHPAVPSFPRAMDTPRYVSNLMCVYNQDFTLG